MVKKVKGYIVETDFGYIASTDIYFGIDCSKNIEEAKVYPSRDVIVLIAKSVKDRWTTTSTRIVQVVNTYELGKKEQI